MDILYKKRTDGKLQTWYIEVVSNRFRVTSGMLNGKNVVNKWTIVDGKNKGKKNETSPEEQALKEAQAKHKKQTEKGYTNDPTAVSTSAIFKPMLAQTYKQGSIKFPVYDNPKLDGIRCIATKNGLFSRNAKEFVSVPHIHKFLQYAFEQYPDLIIDGELYADKYSNNFNKICSIVKRSKPSLEDILFATENVEYHVYDCILKDKSAIYSVRKKFLDTLLKDLPCIKLVKETKINNQIELDDIYERHMKDGYEGQIIRLNEKYDNKRSNSLLKRKEFLTEEYEILNIAEGIGNRAGTAGYAELETPEGESFRSNFKGPFDFLEDVLLRKDEYIGKLATVKYFNKTPGKNIPRFPYIITIRDYE